MILDPDPDEPAMSDEIFGPILPVVTVDDVDEAISFVNARPKPLASYAFSGSRAVQQRVIDEVPAGGVVVNHIALHFLVPAAAVRRRRRSGMGAYHGKWGF